MTEISALHTCYSLCHEFNAIPGTLKLQALRFFSISFFFFFSQLKVFCLFGWFFLADLPYLTGVHDTVAVSPAFFAV